MKTRKLKALGVVDKVLSVSSFVGRAIYAYKYKDPIHIAHLSSEIIGSIVSETLSKEIENMDQIDYYISDLAKEYCASNSNRTRKITHYMYNGFLYEFDDFVVVDLGKEWYFRTDNKNLHEVIFDYYINKYKGSIYITNSKKGNGISRVNVDDDALYSVKEGKVTTEIVDKLEKYRKAKVNRSVLFYGEPGSGKSTLIKSVCHKLGINTYRVPANVMNILPGKVYKHISKNKNINGLIIEDIDKIAFNVSMLETIDSIKNNLDFIFFSANNKENINSAFMRMERIDEIIEINGTDVDTGIAILGDEELAKKMSKYPVVCLLELAKRQKVLGKEEGYKDFMKDDERIKSFLVKKEEKKAATKETKKTTEMPLIEDSDDDDDDEETIFVDYT